MPRSRYAASLVLVAAAYFGAAKLGIELSVSQGVATPVWAPTGIAIAALFLGGTRLWPAVAAGAFLANATSGADIPVAAVIAVGNTMEAVLGSWLLRSARVHSLVAQFAALHGDRAWVEDAPGGGASFRVFLAGR